MVTRIMVFHRGAGYVPHNLHDGEPQVEVVGPARWMTLAGGIPSGDLAEADR